MVENYVDLWHTRAAVRFELWQCVCRYCYSHYWLTYSRIQNFPNIQYRDILVVMNRPCSMWSCHLKLSSGLIENRVLLCADLWNVLSAFSVLLLWQRCMLSVSLAWGAATHPVSSPNSPCLFRIENFNVYRPLNLSELLVYLLCSRLLHFYIEWYSVKRNIKAENIMVSACKTSSFNYKNLMLKTQRTHYWKKLTQFFFIIIWLLLCIIVFPLMSGFWC